MSSELDQARSPQEIRAVWMRISEHAECLRLITGELLEVCEGSTASPDLLDRLANHKAGLGSAVSELESFARDLMET